MVPNRAFVPDALGRLEDRVVLSGVAAPVALSALRFNMTLGFVRNDFQLFGTSGDFARLRAALAQHVAPLPFARADGLGATTNAILDRMQAGIAAHAPGPVASALHQVEAAIRADARARIDAGSVVVTR